MAHQPEPQSPWPAVHAELPEFRTDLERHQPDGSVITTCTTTSSEPDGVIAQRAVPARPDGNLLTPR